MGHAGRENAREKGKASHLWMQLPIFPCSFPPLSMLLCVSFEVTVTSLHAVYVASRSFQ